MELDYETKLRQTIKIVAQKELFVMGCRSPVSADSSFCVVIMKNRRFKLIDESGDKKFFTIIPNFILNHSTAIDQALYLQMKRYAGEGGKCFATEQTLCKQLGIGRKALHNSLKYLIEHGWIDKIGFSSGKTRPINTYKVNDIWKENIEHYKKIVSERAVSSNAKDSAQKEEDSVQKSSKIVSERAIEEEPVKEEPIKKTLIRIKGETPTYGNEDINILTKYLEEHLSGSLDGTIKENRNYTHLLLSRFKKDYPNRDSVELIKIVIDRGVADRFHARNLTNFKYLFYNAQKIIQSAKSDLNKNHITKIS